ncbi:hypothetical protein N7461_003586 [Penicillium sp. DV-2018c]|nr:hypothetical protein N7461_003586 [Penicillium sp. DV-2018c]
MCGGKEILPSVILDDVGRESDVALFQEEVRRPPFLTNLPSIWLITAIMDVNVAGAVDASIWYLSRTHLLVDHPSVWIHALG